MPRNNQTDQEKLIGCLLSALLTFAAVPFVAALKGFTLATMWRWFIVPLFKVPELSVLRAIGLFLTIDVLTQRRRRQDEDADQLKETVNAILFVCVACAFTLGEGWVVMKFMGR